MTTVERFSETIIQRFENKYFRDPDSGCWLWTASTWGGGYGQFRINGRGNQAHRYAYELYKGYIPDGLELDHLCRVRNCVNPDHLEPVTTKENLLRGVGFSAVNARKTHCPAGHAYEGENLYIAPSTGARHCWECQRITKSKRRKTVQ